MSVSNFTFATTPKLHFGSGTLSLLGKAIAPFGRHVLLITGARSFMSSPLRDELFGQLGFGNYVVHHKTVDHEPSPRLVDDIVGTVPFKADVVVGIGGGSVLDAAKAVAAMIPVNGSVKDFLEGVGTRQHPGTKIPFIAIPTTSGTGSEATKNAVLSEVGQEGYKRSLRHDAFVPDVAIVDPVLTLQCPPSITASSGMDAFTQLLESYLSTSSNPVTDALAMEGLNRIARSLVEVYHRGENLDARTDMALASYISGITLANAGLGVVHGFAGVIGGFYPVAHGTICSALMPASNRMTVQKLRRKGDRVYLEKYAHAGKLFSSATGRSEAYYTDALLDTIDRMIHELHIPRLSEFGIGPDDVERIACRTDNKNNPVELSYDELQHVLQSSI